MWLLSYTTLTLIVYYLAINLFGVYLRNVAFQDYFFCFACKEMNHVKKEYDYIIVGSGSAGSIVARRLSEDKNISVLLIEAGSYGSPFLDIPSFGPLLQHSIFDWQYKTVPQENACLGLEKQISHWPMGKIVGGTSMLNNMVYVRGHREDFVAWYKDKPNFNYDNDILPYLKKLESSSNDTDQSSTTVVSDVPFLSNLSQYIMKTAENANFPVNDGFDSKLGFSFPKATLSNGHRWTSWHRLSSVKKQNLEILTNSLVEKVLFKSNYEAYGVRFLYLDDYYDVKASKGIILSAGVIGTPKVLMLSGIGPKEHLEKVKIKPILDLPVGDNLQDHATTGLDLILLKNPPNIGLTSSLSLRSIYDYFINSAGPWTSIGCEALAFFNSDEEFPDLQFMMLPLGVTTDKGIHLRKLVGISDEAWRDYFQKIEDPAFTILPIVLHPKSRGSVRLKDSNLNSLPLINPKYLSSNYDVNVIVRGIEIIKDLIKTEPLKGLGARLNNNTFPGCEEYQFDTKEYWECYVRHLTLTVYHPVGTCQLGKVVDYEFQVKGTSKLYVVDGSVLPGLPSGNPNSVIMMLAEMASDKIKYHRWLNEKKTCLKKVFVDSDC